MPMNDIVPRRKGVQIIANVSEQLGANEQEPTHSKSSKTYLNAFKQ